MDATDLDSPIWHPTSERSGDDRALVISTEASQDLGIGVGDVLQHPTQENAGGLRMTDTRMQVAGIHPSPFRFATYLDRAELPRLALPDVANQLYVLLAAGSSTEDVQRAMFDQPAVASTQPVIAASKVTRDSMEEFVAIFRVLQLFILLLALLIAYNAAAINSDERWRDHATLCAFGLPLRRVMRMDLVEGVLLGILGTTIGIAVGRVVLGWVATELLGSTMPELGLEVAISMATVVTAVTLGVIAVAAAPLLTVRRLRGMDIPGTLRVVE